MKRLLILFYMIVIDYDVNISKPQETQHQTGRETYRSRLPHFILMPFFHMYASYFLVIVAFLKLPSSNRPDSLQDVFLHWRQIPKIMVLLPFTSVKYVASQLNF